MQLFMIREHYLIKLIHNKFDKIDIHNYIPLARVPQFSNILEK